MNFHDNIFGIGLREISNNGDAVVVTMACLYILLFAALGILAGKANRKKTWLIAGIVIIALTIVLDVASRIAFPGKHHFDRSGASVIGRFLVFQWETGLILFTLFPLVAGVYGAVLWIYQDVFPRFRSRKG